MSSTVAKALSLLDFFSENEPEIGLSELARRSGVDKATVHRMLSVMADAGLVEQRGDSRLYRLGAGVLRLARVREKAFPVTSIIKPALEQLSTETGETAHASLLSGRALATVEICESTKGTRVSLIAGQILPFHSTASGQITLAFAPEDIQERVLSSTLEPITQYTVTDNSELQARLKSAQENGFSESDHTNEEDVYGIAAPIFDRSALACGAVAVATPSHRMTEDLRRLTIAAVLRAARTVTFDMGGQQPNTYVATQSRALAEYQADSD